MKNMMTYTAPVVELMMLNNEDILTTSVLHTVDGLGDGISFDINDFLPQ